MARGVFRQRWHPPRNARRIFFSANYRFVTITLVDEVGAEQINLTGLKWAFFDEVTPDLFAAPVDQGAIETTNGSGVLTIDLPHTTLGAGGVGWLIVTNSDGTVALPSHRAFSGPVTVT